MPKGKQEEHYRNSNMTGSQKNTSAVTPAKAGVQRYLLFLDSGFRRNDGKEAFWYFCNDI